MKKNNTVYLAWGMISYNGNSTAHPIGLYWDEDAAWKRANEAYESGEYHYTDVKKMKIN